MTDADRKKKKERKRKKKGETQSKKYVDQERKQSGIRANVPGI
jgi:hypothetical protein